MCDPAPPSTGESTDQILASFAQRLPQVMAAMNSQVGPQAQAQLTTAQNITPKYAELLNSTYADSAPKLANIGADVERINRTGAANTDLEILKGSGGQLVTEAQKLDRQLNPEFYKIREGASDKLGQLLGSIDLNNANPEAERLVNQENLRSGTSNIPSSTNTVSNALQFGDQLQKRRDALGQALGVATNLLQPVQGQFNPVQTALNRPSQNTGVNQFAGVKDAGDQAYQSGNNFLNNVTSTRQQEVGGIMQQRGVIDMINQGFSSVNA